jgi:NAD(P)-dependent dehydrogenase (short-subunit alcohol dehydrogenase family)
MLANTVSLDRKAYMITGPTSGIGRSTAFELAKHGTVVLVGRDPGKLDAVQKAIEKKGQHGVSVVCDLSDMARVRRAATEIVALRLPIVGLINNAGIMQMRPTKNALGWDMTFATNHLGPFALTESLVPHLPDGANVVSSLPPPKIPGASLQRPPAFAAVAISQRTRACAANGSTAVLSSRASTPTRLPNKRCLLRRRRSPVRFHGCISTQSSPA